MAPEVANGFGRSDPGKSVYATTLARRGPVKQVEKPARAVRLKKGDQPDYAGLDYLHALAWRTFKDRVHAAGPVDPVLEESLIKAHMRIRAEEFVAFVMLVTVLGLVIGVVLAVVLAVLGLFVLGVGYVILLPAALCAIGVPFMARMVVAGGPAGRAKSRGRQIDKKISSAMSFVSAMASADVNVDSIFKELAKEKIYGEVAEEAAWITRDTELLGIDILTAIKEGASRTPSKRFQDFLQGVVTTATSGGQLKPYFLIKADQYEKENKLDELQRIETMGLMAETFVTVVVAFPLFLIIMIAIFAVVGSGGAGMIPVLWAIVGLMVPAMQGVFIFIMYAMSQEGNH